MSKPRACWEVELMKISGFDVELQRLMAPVPIWHAQVSVDEWRAGAAAVREGGGRLLAMWGGAGLGDAPQPVACAAFVVLEGLLWLELPLDGEQLTYPDLLPFFPAAARMQRAAADLSGILTKGSKDQRPWLNHGAWPLDYFPLRHGAEAPASFPDSDLINYPFVRVEGDGVHEIAVGPVHAGIIEPGHFRFSVVGEKVLRLEERLGYTHKGIAKQFEQMHQNEAHRLAARVSGDSAVAFSWSYCAALEAITQTGCPPRAANMR